MRYAMFAMLVGACLASSGCKKGPTTSPEAQAEAEQIFTSLCVPCHGSVGAGDGPASAGLSPKPRAFSDKTWQSSVDDAHIEKIIKLGGPGVGKSAAMPANPDLGSKDEVVRALREKVRGFGK
jgi:mono/diheme cytochrome c family protein